MIPNDIIQVETEKEIVSATVVRLEPLHNGHKQFLVNWARKGKMIVMIGSCFENGTERHCIPASEREQMVKPILFRNTFKEIIAVSQKRGIKFVPGRQTVDMVFLVRNTSDGKIYVLLGNRPMKKDDFPGHLALPGGKIEKYETPIKAVVREFQNETGLKIEVLDNSFEPAIVRVANTSKSNLEQMYKVGIYSSEDKKIAGTHGGSSQCFGIFIEDEMHKYEEYISSSDELTDVRFYEVDEALKKGLAFQQTEMLSKALTMFNAEPDLTKHIGD